MSYVKKTNNFFQENVYPKLGKNAISPWTEANNFIKSSSLFCFDEKPILASVLKVAAIAATAVTVAIACCLAVISSLLHLLSLAVAEIADTYSDLKHSLSVRYDCN